MKPGQFFEWSNPLWSFIIATILLYESGYLLYLIGAYAISRRDYLCVAIGLVYCGLLIFGSWAFAQQGLKLLRN
jgi:hypothetical protein